MSLGFGATPADTCWPTRCAVSATPSSVSPDSALSEAESSCAGASTCASAGAGAESSAGASCASSLESSSSSTSWSEGIPRSTLPTETCTALVSPTKMRSVPLVPSVVTSIGSALNHSPQEPSSCSARTKAATSLWPCQVSANMEKGSSWRNSFTARGPAPSPWEAMAGSSTTTVLPSPKLAEEEVASIGPEPPDCVLRIWLPPKAAAAATAIAAKVAVTGVAHVDFVGTSRRRCCTGISLSVTSPSTSDVLPGFEKAVAGAFPMVILSDHSGISKQLELMIQV